MKKIYLAILTLFIPLATKATSYGLDETADAAGIKNDQTIEGRIGFLLNGALSITGLLFLGLAVYGGFKILLSQGDSEAYNKGKDTIVWAVVGLVVLTMAYALTNFVFSQFVTSTPAQ